MPDGQVGHVGNVARPADDSVLCVVADDRMSATAMQQSVRLLRRQTTVDCHAKTVPDLVCHIMM